MNLFVMLTYSAKGFYLYPFVSCIHINILILMKFHINTIIYIYFLNFLCTDLRVNTNEEKPNITKIIKYREQVSFVSITELISYQSFLGNIITLLHINNTIFDKKNQWKVLLGWFQLVTQLHPV